MVGQQACFLNVRGGVVKKKKCRKSRKSRRKTRKPSPTIRKTPPEIWINETIIIIWEEDLPPPPYAQASELTRMLAGTHLAGSKGRKWAERSLSRHQDGKAKGKKGPALLPSGERLPSACNDNQRGVPCNTPLHDYRSDI